MYFTTKSPLHALRDLSRRFVRRHVRHMEPSVICSQDDDTGPNDRLLDISQRAIEAARQNSLEALRKRTAARADAVYYNVFPGEHYRLLAALAETLKPALAVEVGTFTGMGSAALLAGLPEQSRLTTFDILAWDSLDTHLDPEDFRAGKIEQCLDDLSAPETFEKHSGLFRRAELIFLDAPKDGRFEPRFLRNLSALRFDSACLMVVDDIRLLNMIDTWRSIKSPKLDLTSFGHWSGTGLVDLTDGLILE